MSTLPGIAVHPMRASERGFVASTWKSAVADALQRGRVGSNECWAVANAAVDSLLTSCRVLVAVSDVDGTEVAHGWLAQLEGRIVSSFVKHRYQGLGIDAILSKAASYAE